jgi:hypothetical protein
VRRERAVAKCGFRVSDFGNSHARVEGRFDEGGAPSG